jgi:polyisoprenoid-binding protein YceI
MFMKLHIHSAALFAGLVLIAGWTDVAKGDSYKVDPVHSFALFRVHHFNAGNVWGRFNDPAGEFSLDTADPSKDTFHVELKLAKLDTANSKRDADLQGPDWFNARQFPTITFKSTGVKKGDGKMLEVAGDLVIHGVSKPVTVMVEVTGVAGGRAGIEGTTTVKRSDFGMKAMPGGVGDEIKLIVALEGLKQ